MPLLWPQLPTHPLLHSSAPLLKPEPLPGASLTLPLQKAGLRGECLLLHKDVAHGLAPSRTFSHLTPAPHQGRPWHPSFGFLSSHCVFQSRNCLSSCFLSTCPSTANTSQPPTGSFWRAEKFKKKKKIGLAPRGNPRASPLGGRILAPRESLKGWTAGRRRGRVGG